MISLRLGVTPSLPETSIEPATHFGEFMKADSNKDVTCTLLAIEIMGMSKLPSAKAVANAAALAVQSLEGKTAQSLPEAAAASQAASEAAGSAAAAPPPPTPKQPAVAVTPPATSKRQRKTN